MTKRPIESPSSNERPLDAPLRRVDEYAVCSNLGTVEVAPSRSTRVAQVWHSQTPFSIARLPFGVMTVSKRFPPGAAAAICAGTPTDDEAELVSALGPLVRCSPPGREHSCLETNGV
ncbi:MAG: hypothetical protein JWN48_4723 [Myxococcaceae bacterium]|nr:hypothetical protein [Myxococcaceae bacterium]